MSEPIENEQPQPITPTPFGQGANELGAGGCGRVALVGCGVLILLVGIAAIVFLLKADDFFVWTMGKLEAQIMGSLPEDCTDEDRARLQAAFAAAVEAARDGSLDAGALQEFGRTFSRSLPDESGKLSREQVLELIDLLERVAGGEPESEASFDGFILLSVSADRAT